MNGKAAKFVSKNNWTNNGFCPKASSGQHALYNGDCDLLIYNYVIWCHISNLTSEIRFPKFFYHSNLLKMCYWTEMYCEGAELWVSCRLILDSTLLDIKFLVLKPRNFLFSSKVFLFLENYGFVYWNVYIPKLRFVI